MILPKEGNVQSFETWGIKKRNFLALVLVLVLARVRALVLANLSCFFRYSGVVTGVGDADRCRWPMSKWRLLMVCEISCFDCFDIYVCWYILRHFCFILKKQSQ